MAHYGWGDDSDSESKVKSSKAEYDYKSARAAYGSGISSTPMGSRSTRSVSAPSTHVTCKTEPPVGKDIQTDSTHPIVVATDVTGSMSMWPGLIFEKLPLLGKEVERYAPEYAISFCAFGDAYCDANPLQVRDFDHGEPLDIHVAELYPEGGGGDAPESHDLVAYYYLNHCKIDKAVKPIFFFITDTSSHNELRSSAISKYVGDKDQSKVMDSVNLFKKLAEKFSVYVLLKDFTYAKGYWTPIFGEQKVKPIEAPRDIVELLIAIVAGEMGELKDFEMRSSRRHSDKLDRVDRVMKSVRTGLSEKDPAEAGKASVSRKSTASTMKSKKLV